MNKCGLNATTLIRVILLTVLMTLTMLSKSYAVIAYPHPIEITQPDGSRLTIKMYGDEFFSYSTTLDGYIIAHGSDGFAYYANYNTGELSLSNVRAGQGFALGMTKSIPASAIAKIEERRREKQMIGSYKFGVLKAPETGSRPSNVLVILVEYPDRRFSDSNSNKMFNDMMNQKGYSHNGGTGSIKDYIYDNSMGEYAPTFDTYGPFMMPQNVIYYNDGLGREGVHAKDAFTAASVGGVDYSKYSSDGSNVDMVLIYYAGLTPSQNPATIGVWPHKWNVAYQYNLRFNGVKLGEYACSNELRGTSDYDPAKRMEGIGTMTHEFMHVLGLPDVYDTDGTHSAVAAWRFVDVMNGASYNNEGRTPPLLSSYERELIGWLEFEDIDTNGEYEIEPLARNKAYRVKTDVEGEYYLFENRGVVEGNLVWDDYIYDYDGNRGEGMVVYHIDRSQNQFRYQGTNRTAISMWNANEVNNYRLHQCVDFVEASGSESSEQSLSNMFYPGKLGVTTFGDKTFPGFEAWSGEKLGVELSEIRKRGDKIIFRANILTASGNEAQVNCFVKDLFGVGIEGATVNVYEASIINAVMSDPLYVAPAPVKISQTPILSATTNQKGECALTGLLKEKTYIIEASKAQYIEYNERKVFKTGVTALDIPLIPSSENPNANTLKWHSGVGSKAYGPSTVDYIYAGARFMPEHLAKFENHNIRSVTVMADQNARNAWLTITSAGKKIVDNMELSQATGGTYKFDLTKLSLFKENDKELRVIIKTDGGVYVDETTEGSKENAGRGDMLSFDGANWSVLSDHIPGAFGNWVITLEVGYKKALPTAPFPAIKVQQEYVVGDTFTPAIINEDDNVESVSFKINGTSISEKFEFTEPGSYTIVAEIKYSNSSGVGVETIKRIITVK